MIIAYLMTLVLVIPVLVFQELLSKNKKMGNVRYRYTIVAWYVVFVFVIIAGLRDTATISIEHLRQSDEQTYRRTFDLLIGASFSLSNIASFEWGRYFLDWTLANVFKTRKFGYLPMLF